ncbi:MAG: alpha/beta hydrolase [Rhodospirillaceae bacterium]|nr:alpha/beta hydrolase [Rhodospirillaceae bacterium]
MFDGFNRWQIQLGDISFKVIKGGQGPAVVLLHGYPQSHLIWRHLAPVLAESMAVVCLDLKGYGDSAAPTPLPDSSNYAKRQLAHEVVGIMRMLGHETFSVVGHDRGARVGYRLALDHPDRVQKLVSLDIVPTATYWDLADKDFSLGTFHWGFLAQPGGLPERMIGADPDFWLDWILRHWAGDMAAFPAEILAEYRRCFRRPEVIAASCADYRAGATIDDAHDRDDMKRGRRIGCPALALYSGTFVDDRRNPAKLWQQWVRKPIVERVACGHFIPEEMPDQLAARLFQFFAE